MKHVSTLHFPEPAAAPWRSLGALAFFIGAAFLAALPAVWIDTAGWYRELAKPAWSPPAWLFGPVWSALYVLMGVAAWGTWRRSGWSGAVALWFLQLALNAVWTPIFFGFRQPGWAFVEIVLLWCAIVATVVVFARIVRWSAWLLVPYLAWVSFAAALNFAIWRLNA